MLTAAWVSLGGSKVEAADRPHPERPAPIGDDFALGIDALLSL